MVALGIANGEGNAICDYIAISILRCFFYVIYRKEMNLQALQQHFDPPSMHAKIFLFAARQNL